ncbi:NUMOD3 domain-containing DNA-binding protein [Rhizobium sp. 2MFCol3.1]|uniref:NUMOD3 domain-containing DNA-binding protein n=1 Tax=Rhizobium sp. 2MFCol3.1 TaxID=1246459 RepID=UPI00037EFEA7|nr:NUMOD3 domain-containing DNA-binding protein [Rhizobium sp. 2MFCol3.1]
MTMHFNPRDVLASIQSDFQGTKISKPLMTILCRMYESSQRRQVAAGNRFELTFDEYLALITKARRQRMESELKAGTFKRFMESTTGYVLTWKDRPSKAGGVLNGETAVFVNREQSRRNQHFKKGDRHTQASKDAIALARTGTKHSEETKERIKQANTGQTRSDETKAKISAARKGRVMSAETKAKMAEKRAAYWAAKRAATI